MKKIMLVDDDKEIRDLIKRYLEIDGYEVSAFENGLDALNVLDDHFSLIILDVMMPEINGFELSELIRKKVNTPILFVSAKASEQDKFVGFSVGGDDYLAKPFSFTELGLKVKSLIRRYVQYDSGNQIEAPSEQLQIDNLTLDLAKNLLYQDDKLIELTEREFRILKLLASNRGKIFSIQNIYEAVWEDDYYYSSANTVMVHIRNLRKKIEKTPDDPQIIVNVWGRGYKID